MSEENIILKVTKDDLSMDFEINGDGEDLLKIAYRLLEILLEVENKTMEH